MTQQLTQELTEEPKAKLEKLLAEADDCELISQLATDARKRAFFAKLAVQLRAMARDIEAVIKAGPTQDAA